MSPTAEEIAKLTVTNEPAPSKPAPAPKLEKLTPKTLGGLQVQRMADKRIDFLNGLIYGDPGVGKTTFLATASLIPSMSPMLILDVEGGDLSLTKFPDVEVIRVTSYAQMQPIYDQLHKELNAGTSRYRTIGIDNLTELRYFSMSDIMFQAKENAKDPDKVDLDVPDQRAWGKNSNQVRTVVRGFRDLPCHTFFTSHAKEVTDKNNLTKVKPALPGQLSDEVSGFVDLVLYYYIKMVGSQNQRLMLTTKTATQNAKDRSGKLPAVLQEPVMADLIKLILPETMNEKVSNGN